MESDTQRPSGSSQSYLVPLAIIIGFGLIAAAIYFSGIAAQTSKQAKNDTGADTTESTSSASLEALNPVTEDDHIRGNPNAPIMLIEYSDYDCPFCKQFHETLKRIMSEYGQDGKVAWVYRDFPIKELHPNAPHLAEASECVADLGGNDAFWKFSDQVFEERDTNAQTDVTRLGEFAVNAGVDESKFNTCLDSGKMKSAVDEDYNNALAIGGRGTPHTVVVVGDQQGVINGAQPYEVVKQIIENLLKQIDNGTIQTES